MARIFAFALLLSASRLVGAQDPGWLNHGEALLQRGRALEAARAFADAAKTHPDDWRGFHRAGVAFGKARRFDAAIEHLTRALALAPHEPVVGFDLAAVHFNRGDFAASLEAWRSLGAVPEISKWDPVRRAEIAALRGVCALKLNRSGEAIQALEEAVQLAPNDIGHRERFAVLLFNEGRYDRAKLQFEELARREPTSASFAYFLGLSAIEVGDAEAGRKALHRALSIDERHDRAWLRLGRLHLAEGDLRRAEACLRTASEINPLSYESFKALATIALRNGDETTAAELSQRHEELSAKARAIEDELRDHRKALQNDPQSVATRMRIAGIFIEHQRWEEASDELQALLLIDPTHAVATINLAQTLATRGLWAEALLEHEKLLEREPEHPIAHLERARILARQNQHSEAVQSYVRGLQHFPRRDRAYTDAVKALFASAQQGRRLAAAIPSLRTATMESRGSKEDQLDLLLLYARAIAAVREGEPPFVALEAALHDLAQDAPKRREVLQVLVILAEAMGDLGRAQQHAEALRKLPPL